jgi:hypothetical protein
MLFYNIFVGIPCYSGVDWRCLQSVYEMDKPYGVKVTVMVLPGYGAAQARNKLAQESSNYDAILYVDSDQILPKNTLCRLHQILNRNVLVAAGWSMMAVGDARTNIAKYNAATIGYDFFLLDQVPEGVITVDAIGFAATLIDSSVFKKIEYPYFKYVEYPNRTVLSEDLYFCDQLRRGGISIKCDTSLKITHIKQVFI